MKDYYTIDKPTRFRDLTPNRKRTFIEAIAEEEGCKGHFYDPQYAFFIKYLNEVLEPCSRPEVEYMALRAIIKWVYELCEKHPWDDKCEILEEFFSQRTENPLAYVAVDLMAEAEYDDEDF